MATEKVCSFDFCTSGAQLLEGIALAWESGTGSCGAAAARTGPQGLICGSIQTLVFALPSIATRYVSVAHKALGLPSVNRRFLAWSEGTTNHVELQITPAGQLRVVNGDGTQLGITTGSQRIFTNVYFHIQAKITVNNTTGIAQIYLNSVLLSELNLTNVDTQNGGTAAMDRLRLYATDSGGYFDDLVVSDSALPGDRAVRCYMPTGNGTYTAWTGAFGDVDEVPPDEDTTVIESSVPTQAETFTFPATAAGNSILCVNQLGRLRKTDAGARTARFRVRSGGADFDSTDIAVDNSYTYVNRLHDVDPNTAAAWTLTNRNNAEFGVLDQA